MNALLRVCLVAGVLSVLTAGPAVSAGPAAVDIGHRVPPVTYSLLDGRTLHSARLRGHKYILWVMATWCPSCQAGSTLMAQHVADLQRAHAALVEMEAYDNLGGSGPSLASIKAGIGSPGDAPNWYWGVLTRQQTLLLDPKGLMDVFYLVDEHGTVVAQGMAPAAHWDMISAFLNGR